MEKLETHDRFLNASGSIRARLSAEQCLLLALLVTCQNMLRRVTPTWILSGTWTELGFGVGC